MDLSKSQSLLIIVRDVRLPSSITVMFALLLCTIASKFYCQYQTYSCPVGFLQMNNEQLGYDPTIVSTSDGEHFIDILREGYSERLFFDGLMKRAFCVAGRATTC